MRVKYSSWPAGVHMHSMRAGAPEALRKLCGALAGILTVDPAGTVCFSPRKVNSISPSRMVNISSKSCRCGGGPPPSGTRISIRQYRPSVCSPVTSMAYVLPTSETYVVPGSSGSATVRDRDGSSSGIIAVVSSKVGQVGISGRRGDDFVTGQCPRGDAGPHNASPVGGTHGRKIVNGRG